LLHASTYKAKGENTHVHWFYRSSISCRSVCLGRIPLNTAKEASVVRQAPLLYPSQFPALVFDLFGKRPEGARRLSRISRSALMSFAAGGVVVATGSLDKANPISLVYGSWKQTGRNRVAVTIYFFLFDPIGNALGNAEDH
jgi:hypothetical protein